MSYVALQARSRLERSLAGDAAMGRVSDVVGILAALVSCCSSLLPLVSSLGFKLQDSLLDSLLPDGSIFSKILKLAWVNVAGFQ